MSVLVTGGGGFAGRHLLRELTRAGVAEIAATALGEAPPAGGWGDGELEGVEWLPMDVTSADSVRGVVGRTRPELVYHLAGQASVGESFGSPLRTWEVNATGTLRLLSALGSESEATRRVLVISSAEVYGTVAEAAQPIREEAPLRPISPYGVSKAAAELVGLQAGRTGAFEVVVARSFNHIGPGQDERFVLPSMSRQLAGMREGTGERVLRVGNLEVERDLLDVRDVARAYVLLMERGEAGAAYNVCSGVARSLLAVIERLIELSETGARLEVDPERVRPVDIPRLVGDPSRLKALGWTPEVDLDETLRSLLSEVEGGI